MTRLRPSRFLPWALLAIAALPAAAPAQSPPAAGVAPFPWPDGRKAALSLTFDDARESQVDVGLPLLNEHGVRATFYVLPDGARKRLALWKAALAAGHEIGNHSSSHPCTGNFAFSRTNALEDYTLERLEADVAVANAALAADLGRAPTAFAYPCGQSFVGRGEGVRSYVPVVGRTDSRSAGRLRCRLIAWRPAATSAARRSSVMSNSVVP